QQSCPATPPRSLRDALPIYLGVFEAFEREIAGRVFDLADLPVSLLMTPRTDIVWLDVNDPPDVNLHKMAESRRSFYPVGDRSLRSEEHTSELQSRENLVCRL